MRAPKTDLFQRFPNRDSRFFNLGKRLLWLVLDYLWFAYSEGLEAALCSRRPQVITVRPNRSVPRETYMSQNSRQLRTSFIDPLRHVPISGRAQAKCAARVAVPVIS
jgi:hypothetical protein